MKKYLLLIMCLMFITGCGSSEEVVTKEEVHKSTTDYFQAFNAELPQSTILEYDDNYEYSSINLGDNYLIKIRDTDNGNLLKNNYDDTQEVYSFEELSKGIDGHIDYVYNALYEIYTTESGDINICNGEADLDCDKILINGSEWTYTINKLRKAYRVYALHSGSDEDIIFNTTMVFDDIELVKNNLVVLLQELDVKEITET